MPDAKNTKVQVLKIEKLAKLFDGISNLKVNSIIALKNDDKPLIHFVAVPHTLGHKLAGILKLLDVETSYVEVTQDDFGDVAQEESTTNVH